jgi:hypothetical protein
MGSGRLGTVSAHDSARHDSVFSPGKLIAAGEKIWFFW